MFFLITAETPCLFNTVHRGAFCQFPFRWVYYYGSNKSTGKETDKTHLCAVLPLFSQTFNFTVVGVALQREAPFKSHHHLRPQSVTIQRRCSAIHDRSFVGFLLRISNACISKIHSYFPLRYNKRIIFLLREARAGIFEEF